MNTIYGDINTAIYAVLRDAASRNITCPSNPYIRDLLGYEDSFTVSRAIHRMERSGEFLVVRDGMARQIIFPDGEETLCPVEAVGDIVAKAGVIFDVRVSAIYGPEKVIRLVRARQAAMAVANEAGFGPTLIGRVLARDHSTVCHDIKIVHQLEAHNALLSVRMRELRYAAGLLPELQMAA